MGSFAGSLLTCPTHNDGILCDALIPAHAPRRNEKRNNNKKKQKSHIQGEAAQTIQPNSFGMDHIARTHINTLKGAREQLEPHYHFTFLAAHLIPIHHHALALFIAIISRGIIINSFCCFVSPTIAIVLSAFIGTPFFYSTYIIWENRCECDSVCLLQSK